MSFLPEKVVVEDDVSTEEGMDNEPDLDGEAETILLAPDQTGRKKEDGSRENEIGKHVFSFRYSILLQPTSVVK